MLLFFLLQFYFLISSWNSSDRFCNGVLSGSLISLPSWVFYAMCSFFPIRSAIFLAPRSRTRPPSLVSRKAAGAHCRSGAWNRRPRLPGSRLIPAIAICALTAALTAPAEFRLIHGTSTRPQTGSQVSPNIFLRGKCRCIRDTLRIAALQICQPPCHRTC